MPKRFANSIGRILVDHSDPRVAARKINEAIISQSFEDAARGKSKVNLTEKEKSRLTPILRHYLLLHDMHHISRPHGWAEIIYGNEKEWPVFLRKVSAAVDAHERLPGAKSSFCQRLRKRLGVGRGNAAKKELALNDANSLIGELRENAKELTGLEGKALASVFDAVNKNHMAANHAYMGHSLAGIRMFGAF